MIQCTRISWFYKIFKYRLGDNLTIFYHRDLESIKFSLSFFFCRLRCHWSTKSCSNDFCFPLCKNITNFRFPPTRKAFHVYFYDISAEVSVTTKKPEPPAPETTPAPTPAPKPTPLEVSGPPLFQPGYHIEHIKECQESPNLGNF